MTSGLELGGVSKSFGGLQAVDRLDLRVQPGVIQGLIGPNGAGKSTVLNVISGMFAPTTGKLSFDGEDITGHKPHVIARKGIVRNFQTPAFFKEHTVLENVRAAFHAHAQAGIFHTFFNSLRYRNEEAAFDGQAKDILEFLGIFHLKDELAANLAQGYRRLLTIAIAMAVGPKLLLLDEPVTGVTGQEAEHMMALIRSIRDRKGVGILLVEHNMKVVMGVCDRVAVLNFGRKIAEGTPAEVRNDGAVVEAYLGVKKSRA